jgi:hypothetical protein
MLPEHKEVSAPRNQGYVTFKQEIASAVDANVARVITIISNFGKRMFFALLDIKLIELLKEV